MEEKKTEIVYISAQLYKILEMVITFLFLNVEVWQISNISIPIMKESKQNGLVTPI